MNKYTLVRFDIYNGEYEYSDHSILKTKLYNSLTEYEVVSEVFCREPDKDFMFDDGTGAKIRDARPILNSEVKTLEKLGVAYVHNLKLKEIAHD
jgi:hypothetical protein